MDNYCTRYVSCTCPCFTITGLQTKFDFSSPFFVVDTWNLAAMLPISHFLFSPIVFATLCFFLFHLPFLYAIAIINSSILSLSPALTLLHFLDTSILHSPSFSFSVTFLASHPTSNNLLTLYYLRPSLSYIFCRWRPADLLWHSGWRRSRRQYRLGGGKGDGEAGMWGRWLYTSQNHGKRSIREHYMGASSLVIVFCPVGFVHKELN